MQSIDNSKLSLFTTRASTFYADLCSLQQEKVQEIAQLALKELAVTLLYVAISCCFVATPLGMAALVGGCVGSVALNSAIRLIVAVLSQSKDNACNQKIPKNIRNKISTLGRFESTFFFSAIDCTTRGILFHECGHALAYKALLQQSQISIKIFPFVGGETTCYSGNWNLSQWGKQIGRKASNFVISAAGPAANLLSALIFLGIAHYVRESHPTLSLYLNAIAIADIANQVFYALSAYISYFAMPGHDFIALAAGGLPRLPQQPF